MTTIQARRKTVFGMAVGEAGEEDEDGVDQASDDDVGWYESEDEIDLGVEPHRRSKTLSLRPNRLIPWPYAPNPKTLIEPHSRSKAVTLHRKP